MLLGMCLAGESASALAPQYQTDYQLVQLPCIVVARWDKAGVKRHDKVRGDVVENEESFTELNVLRTIKGDIRPGRHPLLMGFGIGWEKNGTGLNSWSSTQIEGDVDDVTQPNIWFLVRSRSWDETDKQEYLRVPHYRAIQPVSLEAYFAALSSSEPEKRVPGFLSSDNPEIVKRVLYYLCGGIAPWPYEPDEWQMYSHPSERERLLRDQAGLLRESLLTGMVAHRHLAAAVYAELAGPGGSGLMTMLLSDPDAKVRAVASGVLVRSRHEASLPKLADAVRGLVDADLACAIIREASSWGNRGLVPLLISFLQEDSFGSRIGSDVRIAAIKARDALHDMTGCWFPFDVSRSQRIWTEAVSLPNWGEAQRHLRNALPYEQCPIRAELFGPLNDSRIRVVNISDHPVRMSEYPNWVEASTSNIWATIRTDGKEKSEFVTLDVGGSTSFRAYFSGDLKGIKIRELSLAMFYKELSVADGMDGWIGWVEAKRIEGEPSR